MEDVRDPGPEADSASRRSRKLERYDFSGRVRPRAGSAARKERAGCEGVKSGLAASKIGVAGGIGGIHRVDIDGNPRADVGEEGCGSHLRNLLRNWGK